MAKRCKKNDGEHHDFIDCLYCGLCLEHCDCDRSMFDADELGLDPETDNTPDAGERHA